MLDAVFQAMGQLADPQYLLYLMIGLALGIVIGILPGVGGGLIMAMVLPFAMTLPGEYIIVVAIGALAVVNTADSITSILVGVPGTSGGAATVIDGHALSAKGEAGRAMAAAFTSSIIGGILGGLALLILIPMARPIIMAMGSPEILMLCILGLTCVGMLSGRAPMKGIVAAAFGLLLAMVGSPPTGGYDHRFTLGTQYLWGGIPLVPALLGLFALPEAIDLVSANVKVVMNKRTGGGWFQGTIDSIRNMWLIVRCSAIGGLIGFIPGIGGSIACWVSYAHTVQSAKDKSMFGKGDIRGVIGPECSNNACRGGELIPTLFFGVPGSSTMAMLLVMLVIVGVVPGPDMIGKNLNVTLLITFSLMLANIVGGLICFTLARPLAFISLIPPTLLAGFVMVICLAGAWQTSQHWGDLVVFFVLGFIGWAMKHAGFSRPAAIIGLVLGESIERYLFISVTRFGWQFLLHPWVVLIGIVTVAAAFIAIRWQRQRAKDEKEAILKEAVKEAPGAAA